MYATKQDLLDRFGQAELENVAWDNDLDALDETAIERALTDAAETADLYIAAAIKLPLATIPAVLVSICSDIARYNLQGTRPLDEVTARYKAAISQLKDISRGRATLAIDEQGTTGPTVDAKRTDDDRVFSRETLAGY